MRPESPAIQLLDAMRAGDDRAVVAAIGQSTTVTAENLPWACRGPDEVDTMLREARERFPGLTFESSARHVGFGVVIEEARVRDVEAEAWRRRPRPRRAVAKRGRRHPPDVGRARHPTPHDGTGAVG